MADARHDGSAAVTARIPPHNLDAEASVLGAMLLSRDAIADAIEVVSAEHFYKPAHVHVFDAITSLYSAGEPADPVTVAEELTRAGVLDRIGGSAALVTLQANTPATSSASTYARIVLETAMLRRMIGVANDIAEIGYSRPDDVEKAIDHAESLMYRVAEGRAIDSLAPISELLDRNLDRLEQLYERGETLTGTPSGYADLDDLLSGLQPNALIVVGARPAMGKTAFALGMAAHAAVEHQRPVLLFSLEMSQLEISQRLLCSEARVDSKHVRDGKLTESDWAKISNGVGRLAEAPLWIDDNPNLTLMEIRAKARRLKSRTGDLGMVIIDYLQLMTGRSGAESRQVEVAELSRGLKILARELQVPVVALSQLSRALESRQDKRPMLADLRESGCLTGDTRLLRADNGAEVTLAELVSTGARDVPVWALDDSWRMVPATLTHAFPSGTEPVFRMSLRSGREITATANHRFRTHEGWRRLDELGRGDLLAVPRRIGEPLMSHAWDPDEVVLLAHMIGDGSIVAGQPVRYATADSDCATAVAEAARRRFGIAAVWDGGPETTVRAWSVRLPSPHRLARGRRHPFRDWLEPMGLWGLRSYEKFVPSSVFGLADDQIRHFLHHLWATDGSVTVRTTAKGRTAVTVYYATTSRRLADDVRQLLLRVGVSSRVRRSRKTGYRESWHVLVTGVEQQSRFLTDVGVFGARSRSVDLALEVLGDRRSNPTVDLLPLTVWSDVRRAMAAVGMSHRGLASAIGETYCGSYLMGDRRHPSRARLERMAGATGDCGLRALATSDVWWDEILEITQAGVADVYDATVLEHHNFVANGVIAHNSIEQDADVVLFIYRDEVYHPESADVGTAEIVIAKHRNGPTGTVRLAFLPHYTRFANMARVN